MTPSHDNLSDPAFVKRLQARDTDALKIVVTSYLDQIFRAARGAGLNQQQAEDVTQETFATFIQTVARFEGRSHVRTWLFGILYNKISEARRGIKKETRTEDIEEIVEQRFHSWGGWASPPRATDLDLEEDEIRALIDTCLELVPEKQRLAFIMREVEGISSEEIRNTLDVTVTHLGVMLYRVRNRLRECLEKWGVKR